MDQEKHCLKDNENSLVVTKEKCSCTLQCQKSVPYLLIGIIFDGLPSFLLGAPPLFYYIFSKSFLQANLTAVFFPDCCFTEIVIVLSILFAIYKFETFSTQTRISLIIECYHYYNNPVSILVEI